MTEQSKAITNYDNYLKIKAYGQSPEVLNTFVQLLGKTAPHYIQSALIAVQTNETLMECTPRSIFRSALRAATLGLSCDPSLGHAYIVPYKNKDTGEKEAQFQPGWHGVQHMALRTGKYEYINVSPVYDGESVVEDRITGDLKIEGIPSGSKNTTGLIASFKLLSGYKKSIYMSNEELEEHGRKYSKMYNRSDSIWKTNKKIAYHKTILLKLLRTYGYIDPMDVAVLDEVENEEANLVSIDLPSEDSVTIVDSKPLSTKEANKLLGFEDDEDEPEVEPEPVMEVEIDMEEKTPKPGTVTHYNGTWKSGVREDEVVTKIEPVEESPKPVTNKYARPMDPEVLKEALHAKAAKAKPANEKQTNLVRVLLIEHFADREDERRQAQEFLTGHKHFSEIEPEMISAILDWMKPEKNPDGSGSYVLNKDAKLELTMVARKFMEDKGQQTFDI